MSNFLPNFFALSCQIERITDLCNQSHLMSICLFSKYMKISKMFILDHNNANDIMESLFHKLNTNKHQRIISDLKKTKTKR